MAFGRPSLKARALRLLSQREHSCSELAAKLAKHICADDPADGTAEIARVVDELSKLGFVSDQRTADSVLHAKGQRYGPLKIRQVLQSKGIAPDLISSAVDKARSTELDTARQLWERRFGVAATDPKERARQYRFLTGRGFSPGTIRRLLSITHAPPAD